MADRLLDTQKKKLTLEEFEAWRRALILKSRKGQSVTYTEEEFDLFNEYEEKYEGRLKRVADVL